MLPQAMGQPLRIAVVEDHAALREALVTTLDGPRREVHGLGGAAALDALLARQPIDIALLDGQLPDADGLALARRLRAGHPGIRLVLVSALPHRLRARAGADWPYDAQCDKPPDPTRLELLISRLARG